MGGDKKRCCEECESDTDLKTEFFEFLGKIIIYYLHGDLSLLKRDTNECIVLWLFKVKLDL